MAQRRGSSQFLWFGMVVVVLITRSSMFPPTKRLTEVVHGIQRERKTAELKSFQTLDPAIITHKKVISYSLYGANPKSSYNTGMIANARLARNFFPTWTVRVYHGPTVPGTTLEELQSLGAELVDMANSTLQNKMFWRFIVAGDKSVDHFIIRDADSRLSRRDFCAVEEWLKSGKMFHVLRDHPSHSNFPISGGLWGGNRFAFKKGEIEAALSHVFTSKNGMMSIQSSLLVNTGTSHYGADMQWLSRAVWPKAKHSVLQHDAFSCGSWGGGMPFPTRRVRFEHVGEKFGAPASVKHKDVSILQAAKQPTMCMDRNNEACGRHLP